MLGIFRKNHYHKDLVVGWDINKENPIVLPEIQRFGHELVVGSEGTGKSGSHQLRRIAHDLLCLVRGEERSIVVIEEQGTLRRDAEKIMNQLAINPDIVTILDATNENNQSNWNPFFEETADEIISKSIVSSLTNCDPNYIPFIENDCRWMVRLVRAFFNDHANFNTLLSLYMHPQQIAEIVGLMAKKLEFEPNQEHNEIIEYFNTHILDYLVHEEDGAMVQTLYPQGHFYEGLQVVCSKHDRFNYVIIEFLEEILKDKSLSGILNSSSTFRVSEIFTGSRIVFIQTNIRNFMNKGSFFGNLFLHAFIRAACHRTTMYPCFLTIDDARAYNLSTISPLLELGRQYKVGISISLQSLDELHYPVLDNILNITSFSQNCNQTIDIINKMLSSAHVKEECLLPLELRNLPNHTFVIYNIDIDTGSRTYRFGKAPHALSCVHLNKQIASHEQRKMIL